MSERSQPIFEDSYFPKPKSTLRFSSIAASSLTASVCCSRHSAAQVAPSFPRKALHRPPAPSRQHSGLASVHSHVSVSRPVRHSCRNLECPRILLALRARRGMYRQSCLISSPDSSRCVRSTRLPISRASMKSVSRRRSRNLPLLRLRARNHRHTDICVDLKSCPGSATIQSTKVGFQEVLANLAFVGLCRRHRAVG